MLILTASPYTNEIFKLIAELTPVVLGGCGTAAAVWLKFLADTDARKKTEAEARLQELELQEMQCEQIAELQKYQENVFYAIIAQCEASEIVTSLNLSDPDAVRHKLMALQGTISKIEEMANTAVEQRQILNSRNQFPAVSQRRME